MTQGYIALIDDDDIELIGQFKWFASAKRGRIYAVTHTQRNGYRTTMQMHRLILNAPSDMQVDHINRDGLDNRRANLRVCTQSENEANRPAPANNTSGYKGVRWHRAARKWQAQIGVNGTRLHLGMFDTREEAALSYNTAAAEHFGEFAYQNELSGGGPR